MLCAGVLYGQLHGQEPGSQPSPEMWRNRAAARLKALHAEADQLVMRQRGLLGELRRLEVARQIAMEELRQADEAVAAAEAESAELERTVELLQAERDALRPVVESRMIEMYKLGRARYARLLLSAADVRRFGRATRTVTALAARDERRVRLYERRLTDLHEAIATLTAREAELTGKRAQAVKARTAADRAVAAQNARVREIDAQRDLNAQLTGELQDAQRRLEGTIQSAGAGAAAALPIGPFRGALPWPSAGTVLRRSSRAAGSAAPRPGIEIAAAEGTAVQAVHDGRVAYAGSFDGLGNLVIVDHGGQTFTLYGHLLEFEVAQGSVVGAGQPIGRVGTSAVGQTTLYFELRVAGRPVDPIPWLAR